MNSIYAITPVNLSLEEIISKTSNLLELGIKTYQYRDKNDDLNIIKKKCKNSFRTHQRKWRGVNN